MSKSELVVETPFGETLDDMFKFYLDRDIPTCVPEKVEIAVSQDVYDELQHIKDCVQKTYSLGIPTKDLDTDTIVKLCSIENRHKDILTNIMDSFTLNSWPSNEQPITVPFFGHEVLVKPTQDELQVFEDRVQKIYSLRIKVPRF